MVKLPCNPRNGTHTPLRLGQSFSPTKGRYHRTWCDLSRDILSVWNAAKYPAEQSRGFDDKLLRLLYLAYRMKNLTTQPGGSLRAPIGFVNTLFSWEQHPNAFLCAIETSTDKDFMRPNLKRPVKLPADVANSSGSAPRSLGCGSGSKSSKPIEALAVMR